MEVIESISDGTETTVIRQKDVNNICEIILKAMEDGLPKESHTIVAYEYVLAEAKKMIRNRRIILQKPLA